MAKGKKKSSKKKKAAPKIEIEEKPIDEVIEEEEVTPEEKEEAPEPAEPPKPAKKPKAKPKKIDEEGEAIKFEEVEYVDKFNKEKAFKHVESLAFPRLVGTDGEQKAAKYIKDKFTAIGLKPVEEEFTFTNYASKILLRFFEGLEAGLLITFLLLASLGGAVLSTAFIIGIVLACVLIVVTFLTSISARFYYKFQNRKGVIFKADEFTSKNVIAKIDCAKGKNDASGDVILLAHYDTKSQTFPMVFRITLFYISLILCIAIPIGFICLYILASAGVAVNATTFLIVLWILAGLDIVTIVFLEINRTHNESPGAIDNASGLGIFLELADNFAKEPLEHFNLTFVATGAEELGLQGASAFVKAHESEFNPEDTYFLNIKIAATRGHMYIPGPVGFPPQLPCLEIENLYKKALKRRRIPIEEGKKRRIKVMSPWVLIGSWNDDMIPIIRGFNANRISIGGMSRGLDVVHTKQDTIDKVDSDALDIVGKITAEVLQRLDLRARP